MYGVRIHAALFRRLTEINSNPPILFFFKYMTLTFFKSDHNILFKLNYLLKLTDLLRIRKFMLSMDIL